MAPRLAQRRGRIGARRTGGVHHRGRLVGDRGGEGLFAGRHPLRLLRAVRRGRRQLCVPQPERCPRLLRDARDQHVLPPGWPTPTSRCTPTTRPTPGTTRSRRTSSPMWTTSGFVTGSRSTPGRFARGRADGVLAAPAGTPYAAGLGPGVVNGPDVAAHERRRVVRATGRQTFSAVCLASRHVPSSPRRQVSRNSA